MAAVAHRTLQVKPREFKALAAASLIRRQWTQSDLAREIGKSRTAVSLALNCDRFPKVQEAIRQLLHLPKP